ncbi:hypothetical protein QUA40_15510 [Microcoleus sp. Pol11C3]|uniref:hypothetical protein n=1 Tax=Microcoleus sp. Pol11C3 TaxID=3055390 RepID=UPI002FD64DA5
MAQNVSFSGHQRRESDVWYRRFWGYHIGKQRDFEQHLNYIHYPPVKHNLSYCPHLWYYSSLSFWLKKMFIQLIGAVVVMAESKKYQILMPFPID